jgi:D-aspartate ligase
MSAALITAADHPTGLGTARALAGLDVELIGLCVDPTSRFCRSRVWSRIITVANEPAAYLEKLLDIGQARRETIALFPTQDALVLVLSQNRQALARHYAFVLPDENTVNLLMDKTAFHQWAQKHQFPVPEGCIVDSQDDLNHALRHIAYPIVIKPLFRTSGWERQSPADKIIKLTTRNDLATIRFDLFASAPRFLVQRWINGGDGNVHFCLVYLDRDGRELGYYTGRKLLQWPRLTGSTAIGVGTDNAAVHELAQSVLSAAGLRGLGSLEAKKSDDDGRYYITEPTVGRNNLQSYLATAGGVNLTRLAFHDALEPGTRVAGERRRKAVWIEEYFALQAVVDSLRHRDLDAVGILRELGKRPAFASFSPRDPVPLVLLFREMIQRRLRRLG